MGVKLCQDGCFEHINIEFSGGSMTLRFREYNQTINLFKKVEAYGDDKLVVCSSGWFETEQTIQRHEHRYYVMLDSGRLLNIEDPTRDREFNDECCIIKISNVELD
jgi:hypothetical protein